VSHLIDKKCPATKRAVELMDPDRDEDAMEKRRPGDYPSQQMSDTPSTSLQGVMTI
jgi:hypothetical protein